MNWIAAAEKLWPQVDKTGDCWIWTGGKTRYGYGQIKVGRGASRRPTSTHRLAWELTNGPVPDGLMVCHRCDNPPCCNPAHLFLGTALDNVRDMFEKGRAPKRDQRGEGNAHARLTEEQVRAIRDHIAAGAEASVLARRFGVSGYHIRQIANGKRWAHLNQEVSG